MSSTRRRLGLLTTCGVVAVLALPGAARAAAPTCDDIGAADAPVVLLVDAPGTAGIPCNDPDLGDTLTYAVVTPPAHGSVVDNGDGTATYTPNPGYAGPDQFTFKANDGTSDSNVATAFLQIDTPPTCSNNRKTVQSGRSVVISIDDDILCDDADNPPSLDIFFDTDPAHGILRDGPGNDVTCTPDAGFVGTDSFLYSASDEWGIPSNEGTMTITVTPKPVVTPTPTPTVTPTSHPDTTPPTIALAHPSQKLKNARAKGLAITETSSEPGTLHVTVSVDKRTARKLKIKRNARGAVVIGTLTRAVAAGRTALHVKLSAKARKAFKRARKVKLLVTLRVTDAAGNRATKTLHVTLKR